MKVNATTYTIAQYCGLIRDGQVIANTDYQRSEEVWPPAARSYLIDTILHGFPLPKLTLYPKTDLRARKTIFEIVDGQQRTRAIDDFFNDKLRISGRSDFRGKRFSDLEEPDQRKFIDYSLSIDLVTGATDDEIREMFMRINSYNVPLNYEETRHATHQGEMKWLVVALMMELSPALKQIGAFSARELARMQDARLFSELGLAYRDGIQTYQRASLDKLYDDNDDTCDWCSEFHATVFKAVEMLVSWGDSIAGTSLMGREVLLTLLLAVMHRLTPIATLQELFRIEATGIGPTEEVLARLTRLSQALAEKIELPDQPSQADLDLDEFIKASAEGTNTKSNREIRFKHLVAALG